MASKGVTHRHTYKHYLRNKARAESRVSGLSVAEALEQCKKSLERSK